MQGKRASATEVTSSHPRPDTPLVIRSRHAATRLPHPSTHDLETALWPYSDTRRMCRRAPHRPLARKPVRHMVLSVLGANVDVTWPLAEHVADIPDLPNLPQAGVSVCSAVLSSSVGGSWPFMSRVEARSRPGLLGHVVRGGRRRSRPCPADRATADESGRRRRR